MRRLIRESSLAKGAALCILVGLGSLVVASSLSGDNDSPICDISDLQDWFVAQQHYFLRIAPPGDYVFLQTGYPQVLAFDPDDLPYSMLQGMTGQVQYDCPVYQLYLVEEPETREFVIFNEYEEEIHSVEAAADYDPTDYALARYPDLYSGAYTSTEISDILEACDPARIQIAVKLVPESFYSSYISASREAASAAAALSGLGGGIMMMSSSSSDLVITNIAPAGGSFTNGIEIAVQVPTGFTNKVEIYSFDEDWAPYEGTDSVWFALATNLTPASGTNIVVWTNANPGSVARRFYAAGSDVDEDGDGLSSAMEIFMFNSDPADYDTDDDGFVDGTDGNISTNDYPGGFDLDNDGYVDGERDIPDRRTDPTTNDITPPTVTINWPTNNDQIIFVP